MTKSNGRTSSVDHYFQDPGQAATPPASPPVIAQPPMLNLRFSTDDQKAFPYSKLVWLDYDKGKGILLHFSTHSVVIVGKDLESLYQKLVAFELPEVIEVSERHNLGDDEGPVVEKIREWTKPTPEGNPWGHIPAGIL